jgi:ElaB/YqjD/DUF883 family membrane-anchored ribosome-binding protein
MDAARLQEQYNKELEEMTDDVHAGLHTGVGKLEELQALLNEKSKEAYAVADKMVRENPWAAMGIALGIGCVLGLFLNRRD